MSRRVPLVVDVSRLHWGADRFLRERLGRMRNALADPVGGKPVEINQSRTGAPIDADMRGFGIWLQVISREDDPRGSTVDFVERALLPDTLWLKGDALADVESARRSAWEAVKAVVGEMSGNNWTSTTPYRPNPHCEDDAALGPHVRHVHEGREEEVARAVAAAFVGIPDLVWATCESGRRLRDFRIGDNSTPYPDVAQADPMSALRAMATARRRSRMAFVDEDVLLAA